MGSLLRDGMVKVFSTTWAREADFVFRIAYCVTTGRNTEYAIRTFADSPNVGLAILPQPRIMLFSKQSDGRHACADTDENGWLCSPVDQ